MLGFLLACNWYVSSLAKPHLYHHIEELPKTRVGLVLGTSKTLKSGHQNLYFAYRIQAAVALYKAGKIEKIIVSGDNRFKNYNEPKDMQQSLIDAGIPKEDIVLDYAGFRTLDSMHRARYVFGQEEVIVISQKFHNQRAISIAQSIDLKAHGFCAQDVSKKYGLKTQLREKLARGKLVLDLLFKKKPKFLGQKEEV